MISGRSTSSLASSANQERDFSNIHSHHVGRLETVRSYFWRALEQAGFKFFQGQEGGRLDRQRRLVVLQVARNVL